MIKDIQQGTINMNAVTIQFMFEKSFLQFYA